MKLHRQVGTLRHHLQSYDELGFVIDGQHYRGGVLLAQNLLLHPWGPAHARLLDGKDFQPLLAAIPEVLLLGTGHTQHLDIALLRTLRDSGLTVEAMDSAAACRTYGILLAEDRHVAAALLPVSA
ncbi:MTH938/NDUFAF3 family protein [Acidithiobacillus sp. AMEEHan]|uniref:Mth938-like domain-containing protein n=1 Tax=Acidithiobacillus sp. AMEEHan TaxID=2994951 RepID=UPI0027E5A2D8|nr:MTH938/NDUFAF3 family protein [Acidithiobacillus sp. AMEEHan]